MFFEKINNISLGSFIWKVLLILSETNVHFVLDAFYSRLSSSIYSTILTSLNNYIR